jgi:hypothetical protein
MSELLDFHVRQNNPGPLPIPRRVGVDVVGRGRRRLGPAVLVAVVVLLLGAVPLPSPSALTVSAGGGSAGRYRQFGDASGFRNVLPAGQKGYGNAVEALAAQLSSPPAHTADRPAPWVNRPTFQQLVQIGAP